MKFRASEEQIYERTLVNTQEVLKRLGQEKIKKIEVGITPDQFLKELACSDDPPMATERQITKALLLCDTRRDYEFVLSYALYYMSVVGSVCVSEWIDSKRVSYGLTRGSDGRLILSVDIDYRDTYSLVAKPSKILAKLYGEKVATKICSGKAMKPRAYELHYATDYIPEHYRMLSMKEKHTSCMSKKSSEYGLDKAAPDGSYLHPVMAYENSSNAVLCLLWDKSKERYVARAIGKIEDNEVKFVKAYGTSGCYDLFKGAGLEDSCDLEGLELSRLEDYNGEIVAPYIDGDVETFEIYDSKLVVSCCGDRKSSYETGRLGGAHYCESCEEHVDELVPVQGRYGGEDVCECCRDEYYRYVDRESDYYYQDDCVWSDVTGEWLLENNSVWSNFHDTSLPDDETVMVEYFSGRSDLIHEDEVDYFMRNEDLSEVEFIGGDPVHEDEEEVA